VFKDIFGLNLQLAGSRNGGVGGRDHHRARCGWASSRCSIGVWGLRSSFGGISDDFRDASGFIGRAGIVHSYVDPSYTTYGKPGALLERFTGDIVVDGIWQYQNFIHGRHLQDKKLHFNGNATLRGRLETWARDISWKSFGYDSAPLCALPSRPRYGGPVHRTGRPSRMANTSSKSGHRNGSTSVAAGYFLQGHDENFFEWASGDLLLLSADPVLSSHGAAAQQRQLFLAAGESPHRRQPWRMSVACSGPKIEYQVSRPLFVRGGWGSTSRRRRNSLRDDSRTGAPDIHPGAG